MGLFNAFSKIDSTSAATLFKDPVCGMKAGDLITQEYKDKVYYFCSDHCRQQFVEDPEIYL